VEPKTLGHAVSEVIGKAKHGRVDKNALENAAISDLLNSNFGLENSEITALVESGIKMQDLFMALSAAGITGNVETFEKALALRQESRNWQDVFQALGIDPRGARDMRTVMQRSEIKKQLRDMVNALKKGQEESQEGTGTELDSETTEGSSDQTLDEDSNKDNAQKQESIKDDKDDQNKDDKDDQNKNDKDDQKLEKEHKSDKDSDKNNTGAGQSERGENKGEKKEKRNNERARHKNGDEEGED